MRRLKILAAFILSIVLISSCKDDSLSPVPFKEVTTNYGGYVKEVVSKGTFNLYDISNSSFKVNLQVYDAQEGTNFESLDIYVSFKDNTEDNGTVKVNETKIRSLAASQFTTDAKSGLPAFDLTISAPETLTALGMTESQLAGSDVFNFRQVLNMKDGNSYTTTNTGLDILAGPFYSSPFANDVAVVCPSDLGGSINYETTVTGVGDGGDISGCDGGVSGVVTFKDLGEGKYSVSDITFGQYDCAWGDNPAVGVTLNEACGLLTLTGGDQYSLIYKITLVSNDGTKLVINWENDYGDMGTSTLTRQGGWPDNLYTK